MACWAGGARTSCFPCPTGVQSSVNRYRTALLVLRGDAQAGGAGGLVAGVADSGAGGRGGAACALFLLRSRLPLLELPRRALLRASGAARKESNLVDSASSHTLVSKIKPCMSKYKQVYTVKLRMAHYISYSLFDSTLLLG